MKVFLSPLADPVLCSSEPPTSETTQTTKSSPRPDAQEGKHPAPFYRLCWAVLCERWAAFILTSTAALMLCERFGFPSALSLRWLGIASAANYVGSLPGGYVMDRLGDSRRGLAIGSLLLLLGYVALSLPSLSALYVAFALLLAGHSLFKPSTQGTIASLYPSGNPHIEGAHVMLHFMANIGAAGGSLLAGVLVKYAGWNVTYGCAALVMSVSGVLAWPSRNTASCDGSSSTIEEPTQPNESHSSTPRSAQIIAGLSLAMFLFTLCTAQAEGALLLWSRDRIDRVLLGFEIPIAWFLAFPSVLVLLLAPIQIALLPRIKQRIGTAQLISFGLGAAALCFAVLLPTTMSMQRVSVAWMAGALFFFVLAELLIAPLGLALLLRSAPPGLIGIATGLWYGASAFGYLASGEIGALWSRWPTRNVLLFLTALPTVGAAVFCWLNRNRPLQADRIAP